MSFDVFGDFAERGYLRNTQGLKDAQDIKAAEHRVFLGKLEDAVAFLKEVERISYQDVLNTHQILFSDFYPWAGQDRATTAPDIAVTKGGRNDLFAHPQDAKAAIDYALHLAQNDRGMADKPGEIIGYLAHGHPFLDGNGRTIIVVADELARREGISIDWQSTNKTEYLAALTRELETPGQGELDSYLKPFLRDDVSHEQSAAIIAELPGLGPDEQAAELEAEQLEAESGWEIDPDLENDYDNDGGRDR